MPEKPIYLIAGGPGSRRARGPDPLIQQVFETAGVPKPRVAYVGAASGDNAAFLLFISRILRKAGAGKVTLAPLCGRRGSLERALPVLEEADIVFVSGGDVEAGMEILKEKRVLPHLQRLHKAGKPFFGVSAGSIMLARQWVRWSNPDDDSTAETFPCLDFAPVLCDTHGEGDDWVELKALLALCPSGTTGYGIVSGSAIVVKGRTVKALGGEVHVFRKGRGGVVQAESLS